MSLVIISSLKSTLSDIDIIALEFFCFVLFFWVSVCMVYIFYSLTFNISVFLALLCVSYKQYIVASFLSPDPPSYHLLSSCLTSSVFLFLVSLKLITCFDYSIFPFIILVFIHYFTIVLVVTLDTIINTHPFLKSTSNTNTFYLLLGQC